MPDLYNAGRYVRVQVQQAVSVVHKHQQQVGRYLPDKAADLVTRAA